MKPGDRVRVGLAGYGVIRALGTERASVSLDGFGWIAVPLHAVENVDVQFGDEITDLQQLKGLPRGAMVAAGNSVNVANGDETFTMILNGVAERHTFKAWMLHRPCRVIHIPRTES